MSKLDELTRAAQEATQVRGYQTDPDVVALRIERIRAWCDRLVWTGIVLGLLFTMANVQHFAAGDTAPPWDKGGSIDWVIAWLLDPMVSLVLIGVLMGEQVINRYGLKAGGWVRLTKWVALACTYAMNTWSAWADKDPAHIVQHSVPPLIVVCAVEAIPTLRRQITEAVTKAYLAAVRASTDEIRIPNQVPPAVAPETYPDEVNTDAWPDTPEYLTRWNDGEEVRDEVPDEVPVPEAVPAVPPPPDPHQVQAASLFADEVRNGKVPGIKRLQRALRIGQDKAYEVQAYLSVLATK